MTTPKQQKTLDDIIQRLAVLRPKYHAPSATNAEHSELVATWGRGGSVFELRIDPVGLCHWTYYNPDTQRFAVSNGFSPGLDTRGLCYLLEVCRYVEAFAEALAGPAARQRVDAGRSRGIRARQSEDAGGRAWSGMTTPPPGTRTKSFALMQRRLSSR